MLPLKSCRVRKIASLANPLVRVRDDGMVQVHVKVLTDVATQTVILQAHGATVELSNAGLNLIQAWVPAGKLQEIAALPQVQSIRPPDYAVTRVGRQQTQGDTILKADQLRTVTGTG